MVKISEGIRHGAIWFTEILDALKGSDYFILLYTDEDTDWSWCMFEAGAFLDLKKASLRQKDLVGYDDQASSTNLFFVSPPSTTAPGPFNQFQRTPATVDGIKEMFRQMFVDDTNPYHRYWWSQSSENITAVATKVVELAFGSTKVRKQYPLKHYVRLDIAGTLQATTETLTPSWKSRVGSFGYPADAFSKARIVRHTGVDQILGWNPSNDATWGEIGRDQPWSKKLEEEFFI